MSRDEGFAVMDVSTDIVSDPKFRRLQREHPEHVACAFMAYLAVLGESWKAGRRVSVIDAWPVLVPFDPAVIDSMVHVRLIERGGLPPRKAWDGWYRPASERRAKSRDRWARYNAHRDAVTTSEPRGSDADTATSVPPVRSSLPSVPPSRPSIGRAKNGINPEEERRRALDHLSEEYKAGRLSEVDYERQRRVLAS